MSNSKRILIFIIIIIVVIIGIVLGVKYVLKDQSQNELPNLNTVSIEGYGIHLDDLDTSLYKDEYKILKDNLLSETIEYEEYAKSIAKMFIIDLYTINNKQNKYDIGGIDFVYPASLDNYKLNVSDTIYKYVEDNSKNDRNQQLPVVNSIEITKFNKGSYEIEGKKYESYIINLKWDYVINLGYDEEGEVIIIKDKDKLYVVEKN